MKKYKIGYTQGTYDLFHIGHLNLLNHAKEQCDYLIVGINTNRLVQEYKNKQVIIDEVDRASIVQNIKSVDFLQKKLNLTQYLSAMIGKIMKDG